MSWISATYRIRAPRERLDDLAHALALEQSVELPDAAVTDPYVREHVMGRVAAVNAADDDVHSVTIRLATATTGNDVAQTLNMLFGNSALHPHVELTDVDFPPDFLARFPGPRFGIEGLRERVGALRRPLTCAALKPQGLSSARLAALCYDLAANGIDIVKDDHGLADQTYAPFAERVVACQRAVERAARERGRPCLYAPSLVGAPGALARQARIACDAGAGAVLIAPALVGMPAFHEFVLQHVDVPVLAHPALGGAARIAPPLLIGKLFRWLGADAVIFPNFGGRFAYDEATCAAIATNARGAWGSFRATLPVPAGGLSVERVDEIAAFYGPDVMLLIGGSLLAAADRGARTRAFVAAIERASRIDQDRETVE
ncbi:MAG TPA: RuBisCO large subunit C-terminal-like domain-containing protein [Casimicrobiaceae bacterium]|nr:RuBisCO large subunit C-terminal-like domain-containing protein [Casimicrobiaceae bacterium]